MINLQSLPNNKKHYLLINHTKKIMHDYYKINALLNNYKGAYISYEFWLVSTEATNIYNTLKHYASNAIASNDTSDYENYIKTLFLNTNNERNI